VRPCSASCFAFGRGLEGASTAGEVPLRRRYIVAVLCTYLVLAAVYTHPVLQKSFTGIANDPYDPILNTSILWWNATTLPFSPGWWSPPHFHPSRDVAAFTENLVGISVIATPIYWLTGSALAAYNICFYLSWALSAFTAYLLVWFLVRRQDAAFLAGLIYGFTPYRTAELGHLQMLSVYWFPLVLLGLHGFLLQRRGWWLLLFGAAWVLQALANGYFIFFGAVVIGLWLVYFCARHHAWRAAPAVLVTWAIANAVLLPVLWKYHTVHQHYGLRRSISEAAAFSAPASAWFEVSYVVWFWNHILPESKDNLFPGLTVVLIVLGGVAIAWRRHGRVLESVRGRRRLLIGVLIVTTLLSTLAMVLTLVWGPWSRSLLGITVRVTDLDRAVWIFVGSIVLLVAASRRARGALSRRSDLVFYVAATIVLAVFCCGPVLRTGDSVVLEPMPYRWLLYLPGFESVRVPTRFWMLGMLCFAVAGGISFARYGPSGRQQRRVLFAVSVAGILLDGWTRGIGMPDAPRQWPKVERRDQSAAVIELPLGPAWDAAATFRAARHRRPVVNGVSGYDPPHYVPLMHGLDDHDPALLVALSSFGALDVVVNGEADPDGALARYAAALAGEPTATDGTRRVYRIPASPRIAVTLGKVVPIVGLSASSEGFEVATDGNLETEWHDNPRQMPGHWLSLDLGSIHDVGGLTLSLGEWARDFPRHFAIDASADGSSWEVVWQGRTASTALLAAIDGPRECAMRFAFASRPARFIRMRTLADHKNLWRVAEVSVHAPGPHVPVSEPPR
jgi:hypothetical protein